MRLRGLGIIPVVAALGLGACSSFELNPSLGTIDFQEGYRLENVDSYEHPSGKNTEKTFFILTLSGGGTRAAALSYGVMKHLRETAIEEGRSVLDEVDVISSVSGGSFASAYYAAFGEEVFFRDFREQVLDRKIQGKLLRRVLAPWNWPRLWSPKFGRSDLANELYDRKIFAHKTYAQMPRAKPLVILNATDMSLGAQFSFIQEHFDRLCADLDGVQLSRAVTSSSAFPGGFTPLTFANYNKAQVSPCDYDPPGFVKGSLGLDENGRRNPSLPTNLDANPALFDRARTWRAYEDGDSRPFLHLIDGGVSDNIGLRGPVASIAFGEGDRWSLLSQVATNDVDRVIFVVVDARPRQEPKQDKKASPPNILSVLSAAASRPMANYSTETVEQLQSLVADFQRASISFNGQRRLCDSAAARRCEGSRDPGCEIREREKCYEDQRVVERFRPPNPKLHTVYVRFDAIRDEATRRRLQTLPTTLQLPREDVQLLIDSAATLLEESQAFADLLEDLRSDG